MSESITSYERLWDDYAKHWDQLDKPGQPRYLGDEWGSLQENQRLFDEFLKPWLTPQATVVEIGPGGGKYTVMTAPHVERLISIDVSSEMLRRTQERIDEEALANVELIKGNGLDLSSVPDHSADVVFSFDVFVHLAPADTYAYMREMRRILKPGGVGSLTLANILSPDGFQKFINEVDLHRQQRGAEQFGYLTPTIASRFLFSLGYSIVGYSDEINNRDFAVVFRNDSDAGLSCS